MIKDRNGWTPVHYLAYKGVKEVLSLDKELLKIKNDVGETPIYWLAWNRVKIPDEYRQYI